MRISVVCGTPFCRFPISPVCFCPQFSSRLGQPLIPPFFTLPIPLGSVILDSVSLQNTTASLVILKGGRVLLTSVSILFYGTILNLFWGFIYSPSSHESRIIYIFFSENGQIFIWWGFCSPPPPNMQYLGVCRSE